MEERLENWPALLGLLVAALVGFVALSGWTLGLNWIGLVACLVVAVIVHFAVSFGALLAVPWQLRLVVLVVGAILMLWPQPGITPFGYHTGDLLVAAGVAMLVGLALGWNLVNLLQLGLVLVVTSLVYGMIVGYPLAIVAGVITLVLLFVVSLVQSAGGTRTATAS